MISTACWRGYLCWYRVSGGSLRLVRLMVGSGTTVAARTLLLGRGFIRSTYVHMGFHPVWKFAKVIELLLREGAVTDSLDRSAELAAFRQRIANGEAADPDGPRGGADWVRRTFSLDYSRSFTGWKQQQRP